MAVITKATVFVPGIFKVASLPPPQPPRNLHCVLLGSLDGETWVSIKRHITDPSLAGPFASHTWQVKDIKVAYRHIRILQTGTNSSNHNFLVVSGIELYGELFESC